MAELWQLARHGRSAPGVYRGSPLAPERSAYRLIATVHDETAYQHAVG